MSNDDSGEITSEGRTTGKRLDLLRMAALIAVAVGAAGSVALTLRASERAPRFLLVLFIIWVLSPFAALAWANLVSRHWSVLTRAMLYGVSFVIVLSSLAIYGGVVSPPAGSPHAFIFVAVPPVSLLLMALLMAIVVPLCALILRRQSRRAG